MQGGLPPPPFGHYLSCFILHFNREMKGSPVDAVFSSVVNHISFSTKFCAKTTYDTWLQNLLQKFHREGCERCTQEDRGL